MSPWILPRIIPSISPGEVSGGIHEQIFSKGIHVIMILLEHFCKDFPHVIPEEILMIISDAIPSGIQSLGEFQNELLNEFRDFLKA